MSLTAYVVRNCAGTSLRLKSISPSFKDVQLKTDEEYLFKSPEEYASFYASVTAWVQLRKLEINPIVGKAAQREIEKNIVVPQEMQNYNDFDEDMTEVIEVRSPAVEVKETEIEAIAQGDASAVLKQELADLQSLLKDTVDAEAKKKINARLKEIKKILK